MILDGVMLNAYPDSCGGDMSAMVRMLARNEFRDVFRYFYVLPSMFQSDLDRGFSVIAYDLDTQLVSRDDLQSLSDMGLELKLDFVLNHLSVGSPQFQDLLEKGDDSPYVDAFIDWNRYWEGYGTMSEDGFIVPDDEYLEVLFMRKPGLPILRIPFPDGSYRYYWNTFYQKVLVSAPKREDLLLLDGIDEDSAAVIADIVAAAVESELPLRDADFGEYAPFQDKVVAYIDRECSRYLGQMDLNAGSDLVWDFYEETFGKLASYGARIVRLDAFAYLHKEIGASNFFNEPGTWDYLQRIRQIADRHDLALLPEIHSKYEDGLHQQIADRGYPIYDFFFPGLLINAIETGSPDQLVRWIEEIRDRNFSTVNMLGCHDGIPVLDVKGLLPEEAIDEMIDLITSRGGRVKDLYGADGQRISYYQVNATFFSALGEDEDKMLLARAIQCFMPGIPEVWYLDIFAGRNDLEAADKGGHKEINRTNLSEAEIERRLEWPIVRRQLELLRFRNTFPAFGEGAELTVGSDSSGTLTLRWCRGSAEAGLAADLHKRRFELSFRNQHGEMEVFTV